MKEIRIYSRRLAEYLTEKGFYYERIVQDVVHTKFKNWIFMDTPELRKAMSEYSKENRR